MGGKYLCIEKRLELKGTVKSEINSETATSRTINVVNERSSSSIEGTILLRKQLMTIKNNVSMVIGDRYNTIPTDIDSFMIEMLLMNRPCQLVSKFKDFMIFDYEEEFLSRLYKPHEIPSRVKKLAAYYQNYQNFFNKPSFRDFKARHIIHSFGELKAEEYYKKNYEKTPKKPQSSTENLLDQKIFSTLVKENLEKTIITKSNLEEMNANDSFLINKEDFNNKLFTAKSGLFTKRSKEGGNSIENILSNFEDKIHKEIDERIIDKVHKNKKLAINNYSTTDKTKADEVTNITKYKRDETVSQQETTLKPHKTLKTNKSSSNIFLVSRSNGSLKLSHNAESRGKIIESYLEKGKKLNIKLNYKDFRELVRSKSPSTEKNQVQVCKLSEYKGLNLKKIASNNTQSLKSFDPKSDTSGLVLNHNKGKSTELFSQNKIKKSSSNYLSNPKPDAIVETRIPSSQPKNLSRNKFPSQNTLRPTFSLIKKENTLKNYESRGDSATPFKELLNVPQLNLTKTLFSKHGNSRSSLHSNINSLKIMSIRMPNSNEIAVKSNISQNGLNSRNPVKTRLKSPSNPSGNKIEHSQEKIVFTSYISLNKQERKKPNAKKEIPKAKNSKHMNDLLKEQIKELLEIEKRRKIQSKISIARSTSRNKRKEASGSQIAPNLQTTKLVQQEPGFQTRVKNAEQSSTSRMNIQIEFQNNMKKISKSSSKVRIASKKPGN